MNETSEGGAINGHGHRVTPAQGGCCWWAQGTGKSLTAKGPIAHYELGECSPCWRLGMLGRLLLLVWMEMPSP